MTKKELRLLYKEKRNLLTSKELNVLNDLILINFQKIALPELYYTLSFIPIQEFKEVNTHPIESYLEFKNFNNRLTYPVCDFDTQSMNATFPNENMEFEKTAFNTIEPVDGDTIEAKKIDLIIVPLLAFDDKGYRVGYGKGFYDRYFTQTRKDCLKIGLSFFDAVDTIDDLNEWDQPLDFCVTPNKVYEF